MSNYRVDGSTAQTDNFITSLPPGTRFTQKGVMLKSLYPSFSTSLISWSTLTGVSRILLVYLFKCDNLISLATRMVYVRTLNV